MSEPCEQDEEVVFLEKLVGVVCDLVSHDVNWSDSQCNKYREILEKHFLKYAVKHEEEQKRLDAHEKILSHHDDGLAAQIRDSKLQAEHDADVAFIRQGLEGAPGTPGAEMARVGMDELPASVKAIGLGNPIALAKRIAELEATRDEYLKQAEDVQAEYLKAIDTLESIRDERDQFQERLTKIAKMTYGEE